MTSKRNREEPDSSLLEAINHRVAAGDVMKSIEEDPKAVRYQDTTTKEYPLHAACRRPEEAYDVVIMKLLEIFPEAAQCRNCYREYPLHLNCKYRRSENLITKLVELYPTAVREQDYSDTMGYPIYSAIVDDLSLDMFNLFAKADPLLLQQKTERVRQTPFHFACWHDTTSIVEWFLRFPELEINTRDCHGHTPLHTACLFCNDKIIKLLLCHPKIDVNASSYWNLNDPGHKWSYSTALHLVMRLSDGDKRYQIASMLLDHPDINVNKRDSMGRTALHIAVKDIDKRPEDCILIVQLLLLHPCILIDLEDCGYKTPLNIVENGIHNYSNRYYDNDDEKEAYSLTLRCFQEAKRLLDDYGIQRKWQSYQYLSLSCEGLVRTLSESQE